MQKLQVKFDKNYKPTVYEKVLQLVNMLHPYFKTLKAVMTLFTPSKYS